MSHIFEMLEKNICTIKPQSHQIQGKEQANDNTEMKSICSTQNSLSFFFVQLGVMGVFAKVQKKEPGNATGKHKGTGEGKLNKKENSQQP